MRLAESEIRARLNGKLSLAAVNSPTLCVVAGPFDALESLEQELSREQIPCRRLVTSHAFHSAMMDPIIEPFTARVRRDTPRPTTDSVCFRRHRAMDHRKRNDRPRILGAAFPPGGPILGGGYGTAQEGEQRSSGSGAWKRAEHVGTAA